MDALLYMSDMLSDTRKLFDLPDSKLGGLREFMKSPLFKELPGDEQQALIIFLREKASKVGKLIGEFVEHARKESSRSQNDLVEEYREKIIDLIGDMMDKARHPTDDTRKAMSDLDNRERHYEIIEETLNKMDTIIQNNKVKNIENMLLEEADISNGITLDSGESCALFFKKAFLDLFNMQNDHERRTFYIKMIMELGNLIDIIQKACGKQPLVVLL